MASVGPGVRPRLRWHGVGLAAALLALQACTTVTVHAGDGSISRESSFGFVTLRPVPGTTPMLVRSTALGWLSGPAGHHLGWTSAQLTLLPPGCHLILFDAADTASPDLARRGLCADPEAKKEHP